jgi:hypothetical protein
MNKLILVVIGAMLMFSCKKSIDRELPRGTSYQMPPTDVVLELDAKLVAARKKNPHSNPPPVTPPPPTSSIKIGCFLLDFDGQNITTNLWNVSNVNASGLSQAQIAAVVARVQYDYSFDDSIIITTDEAVYNSFPQNKRRRCIATASWEWYGQAGGVAYINSFGWYDETPCFVFTSLLSYNAKYVADAMSHEIAHTTGGRHHADWRQCVFFGAYWVGDDIMGNSYAAANPLFKIAANDLCCDCIEDTKQVIRNSINQ